MLDTWNIRYLEYQTPRIPIKHHRDRSDALEGSAPVHYKYTEPKVYQCIHLKIDRGFPRRFTMKEAIT